MGKKTSPLLLESIRLVDGEPQLLERHQARVDRARNRYYAKSPAFKLARLLPELTLPDSGHHKLRILYGAGLKSWEVQPYEVRPVRSLQVVHADDLRYGHKYANRSALTALYEHRGRCDDVLIVQRGHLTDSTYANLAFHDGSHWYTPAWPLLQGTRRGELVDRGTVRPTVIRLRDLYHFERVRLMNAMLDWETAPTFPTTAVLMP